MAALATTCWTAVSQRHPPGGGGNDTLRGGVGSNVLDGGAGTDLADYSNTSDGVDLGSKFTVMWGLG